MMPMFFSSGSARTRTIANAKGCQGEYAKGALLKREALCALLLPMLFWGCISNSSSKSNAGSTPPARTEESRLPAPLIHVYLENSGSMDGYVKGTTDFENAVYSYLSDLQHADLGERSPESPAKNVLELNYINSQVLQQRPDVQEFVKALEPSTFKLRGGNRNTSDISDILGTILKRTGENDVSIFISDCIFSPGKRYKVKDNADEYIIAQQIGIKNHFREKLAVMPDLGVVVFRLMSQFNGIFYNKFDDPQRLNGTRPYFIWLIGQQAQLKRIVERVDIQQIKGSGVENVLMISPSRAALPYGVLPQQSVGSFKLDKKSPKNTIKSAKGNSRGNAASFKLAVGADFSQLLLPEEYILDPANYTVSNKAYSVEVAPMANRQSSYTHIIKLVLKGQIVSKGSLSVSLVPQLPAWVDTYTDQEGLNVLAEGAMEQTYGLHHLISGVHDAYGYEQNYGTITINIK